MHSVIKHCFAVTWRLYVDPGVSYKWRGSRSIDSNTAINFRINATAGLLWRQNESVYVTVCKYSHTSLNYQIHITLSSLYQTTPCLQLIISVTNQEVRQWRPAAGSLLPAHVSRDWNQIPQTLAIMNSRKYSRDTLLTQSLCFRITYMG